MEEIVLEYTLSQLEEVVEKIAKQINNVSVITLTGSLGAGKTTFVAALLRYWGVQEPVVSPTFTYMNVYELANGKTVYHFDLYRLDSLQSFEQAGFAEYLYQENSMCIIEWPEIIMPLLQKSVIHIAIDFVGVDKRQLVCKIEK